MVARTTGVVKLDVKYSRFVPFGTKQNDTHTMTSFAVMSPADEFYGPLVGTN